MTIKRLKKLLTGFKPEFGNERHIMAMNLISKMKKRDNIQRLIEDQMNEMAELKDEILREANQLEWLIKT